MTGEAKPKTRWYHRYRASPVTIESIYRHAASIGFGATVGTTIGLFAHKWYPQIQLDQSQSMAVGGALGTALHRVVAKLADVVLRPVSTTASFYFKLFELRMLRGTLTVEQRRKIRKELADRYFLK